MRETDVWDRHTDTVYNVWFTTSPDEDSAGREYQHVTVERVVMGDPETGEDVDVDLDLDTEERVRDVIAQRLHDGGML